MLPPTRTASSPNPASSYATAQSFPAANAAFPADSWWATFKDAQLDTLIHDALLSSPSLAEAEARLRLADADANQTRAALYPSLDGGGAVQYSHIPKSIGTGRAGALGVFGLNFSWEIDFWGKNRLALLASLSAAQAARADEAGARLMLATSIASAYVDLDGLYQERDVGVAAIRVRQDSLTLVNQLFDQGIDNQVAQAEAQAGLQSAGADLAATDETIALTRNQLAALMGEGPDRGLAIARPQLKRPGAGGLPATLLAELVGRKPEIVAARWRAEQAAKKVGVAEAAFYPNVNLLGLAGLLSPRIQDLFQSSALGAGVGPAFTLPIFDGGRLSANYTGARAAYDQAVASYDETVVQALHDVADAAASLKALGSRLQLTEAALDERERAHRLALLRYGGGLTDYQSVLVAEDALLAARRAATQLRVRGATLDIALIRALGGGFRTDDLPPAELKS